MPWTVYILKCSDKTLYTGIAKNVEGRLDKHLKGTGAKYTRGRGPLELVYTEQRRTRGQALKREIEIKSLDRSQKLKLVKAGAGQPGIAK